MGFFDETMNYIDEYRTGYLVNIWFCFNYFQNTLQEIICSKAETCRYRSTYKGNQGKKGKQVMAQSVSVHE
jgi:hypothetical protein